MKIVKLAKYDTSAGKPSTHSVAVNPSHVMHFEANGTDSPSVKLTFTNGTNVNVAGTLDQILSKLNYGE